MKQSHLITDKEFEEIEVAIEKAEKNHRGEIVLVCLDASHDYWWVHWFWSTIGFLMASLGMLVWNPDSFLQDSTMAMLLFMTGQVFGLLLGTSFAFIPAVKRFTVPKSWRKAQVKREAYFQFMAGGLSQTELRTGVLIFISHLERQVEILADIGIFRKTGQDYWDHQVQSLVEAIRRGETSQGIQTVIHSMSETLKKLFPADPNRNPNELENHVRSKGFESESFDRKERS